MFSRLFAPQILCNQNGTAGTEPHDDVGQDKSDLAPILTPDRLFVPLKFPTINISATL